MKNKVIVDKLIFYANKILDYYEGLDNERFSADIKLVDACVFNLSQIGELANRVDADFAEAHPDIP